MSHPPPLLVNSTPLLVNNAWSFINAVEISQNRRGLQPLTSPQFTMLEAQLILATTHALLFNHAREPGIMAGLHFLFPGAGRVSDIPTAEMIRAIGIVQMELRNATPSIADGEEEDATSPTSSSSGPFEPRKKTRTGQ